MSDDNSTSQPGYVYLMLMGGFHKIGKSRNPDKRLRDFEMLPWVPEIIHRIASKNMGVIEKTLHRRFIGKRIRGEWFELSVADVHAICSVVSCDNPLELPTFLLPTIYKMSGGNLRRSLANWLREKESELLSPDAALLLGDLAKCFSLGKSDGPGRKSTWPPAIQMHKASGRERIRVNGHDYYLGPIGSDEAKKKYNELVEYFRTL